MNADRGPIVSRRRLMAAVAGFGLGLPLSLGYAATLARRNAESRVIVLGAGDELSVLVTAGRTRLLIAAGTDTTAFGNALGSVLPFGINRIDVVLLAGQGRNGNVAAYAVRSVSGRSFVVVDSGVTFEDLETPPHQAIEVLIEPRRYQLPDGIAITVDKAPRSRSDAPAADWHAIIERGQTRIVIVPDGRLAGLPRPNEPVSALIVTGVHPAEAIRLRSSPALIVSAESVSIDDVRAEIAPPIRGTRPYVAGVFAGETMAMSFVEGGLRLPNHDGYAV